MKTRSMIVVLSGLLFVGCGGGGSFECSLACEKIFDECDLSSFRTPGGTVTASTCVDVCEEGQKEAPAAVSSMLSCIDKTSCGNISTCE